MSKEELKKQKGEPFDAVHATGPSGSHVVSIGNLRVVLLQDEGHWFAQGLEIDYLAEGENLEDAKNNFEKGLKATITLNLQNNGGLAGMLKAAPPEVWKDTVYAPGAQLHRFNSVTVHEILGEPEDMFPFAGIDYFGPAGVLAAAS